MLTIQSCANRHPKFKCYFVCASKVYGETILPENYRMNRANHIHREIRFKVTHQIQINIDAQNTATFHRKLKLPEGRSDRMLEVTGFRLRKRETYFDAITLL